MTSFWTTTSKDADVPKVVRVPLQEGQSSEWWPCFDLSAMGREAYEVRWFEDFRDRWRRALRDERWNFRARLERAAGGA
jgi:hypothetical protein